MFEPVQFIDLAHELARGELRAASPATRARTAYGRLYYGLFLTVRRILMERHGLSSRQVRHGPLYRWLQHSSVHAPLRKLGRDMERLYALRQKADYELDAAPSWLAEIENPELARVHATRVADLARTVPALDFTSVVPLL
jgi:hypothetical protein